MKPDFVICNMCNRKVWPIDCKEDGEDDNMTCDSCGSMVVEVPGLGFVCVRHGKPLVEVGEYQLYHPETVSAWKRFTRAALLSVCLLALATSGWAGEPLTMTPESDEHLTFTLDGALKIDKQSFDAMLKDYPDAKLRVRLVPDPCLATMEAAMRAMEPFVKGRLYEYNKGMQSYTETYTITPETMMRHDEAALKWETAKRCLRKP